MDNRKGTFKCPVCGKTKAPAEGRPAEFVSGPVGDLIRKQHPDWGPGRRICISCLHEFRTAYLKEELARQHGELTSVETAVLESLRDQEVLARNLNEEMAESTTFGQKIADRVASFGGSWGFIMIFAAVLFGWIVLNTALILRKPFDPYPYILLNLVLSCIAAIQAPVIMMSQNRQEARDRLRAEHDYQVNLKAEIEIRQLHVKMDQLIYNSWSRLLEIQQVQIDLLEELSSREDDSSA